MRRNVCLTVQCIGDGVAVWPEDARARAVCIRACERARAVVPFVVTKRAGPAQPEVSDRCDCLLLGARRSSARGARRARTKDDDRRSAALLFCGQIMT